MKIKPRVTFLGGVGLTLLGLLYAFYTLYPTLNLKPHLLTAREKECPPVTSPCVITTDIPTRLGNQILFYWTLMAAAKRHHCTAYLSPNMAEELLPHFRLTMPALAPEVYYTTPWTFVDVQDALSKCRAEFPAENINLVGFPFNFGPLFPFVEDVRRELVLKPEVVDRAQRKLLKISRMKSYKTFVSVHVRRGDYAILNPMTRVLSPDSQFYASAMAHFRSKYGQVAFVVVSDDMKWCKENIKSKNDDVFYEGSEVAIDDFALMANCNHSVIGCSTFAYSAAILSAGDVAYYANYSYPENPYYNMHNLGQFVLDHWVPIAADLTQLPMLSPAEEKIFSHIVKYTLEIRKYWGDFLSPIVKVAFNYLYYLPRVVSAA